MKKIVFIIILFNLISCNIASITAKEENAVQQVLNFYNGKCTRSKGITSKNGINKSYFELEISKSKLLNIDQKNLKTHSANIAYLFFSNLEEDKKNYQEIRVKITLDNGENQEFSYSEMELSEIEKLQPYINQITEEIIKKDYKKLQTFFDKSINIETMSIESLFTMLEKQYGKINKIQQQGFAYRESKKYGNVIMIKNALLVDKIAFSMDLFIRKENSKLISIEFE